MLTLPALATDPQHPEDPREVGEPLWPWFRSAEELGRLATLDPRNFHALQQQDPRAEGGTEWGSSLLPDSIWFSDWPRDLQLRVIALDPSKGKDSKHGDYSAYTLLGRCRDGNLWVEADLARRPTTQIVADGIELGRRFESETEGRLDGFGVESDSFQELLADEFVRQTKVSGVHLPI